MTGPTTSPSLNSALLIAASGLNANQVGISVVSANVSNSQVQGYTAKTAPVETMLAGNVDSGVRTLAITRQVNEALLGAVQNAGSTNQQLSTQNTFLQAFQNNFGTPGGTTNLAAQIGNLQNAFSALTVNPDNPTTQAQAITVAQNLVQQFNHVSQNISQVREQADSQIATSVNNINNALTQVYALNQQIVQLKALGDSTADLEDQRDDQINAIAQEINITTSTANNGAIYIQTSNGVSLLDSTYNPSSPPVSFTPTPVVAATSAYYPPPSSQYTTLSGIKVNGVDITPDITSGNIAGDLNVRDNLMPATQSQLDELAGQLITEFNSNDLQLFQAGTNSLPSSDQVQSFTTGTAYSAGPPVVSPSASMITVQSGGTAGLSTGMTMQFASQPGTIYQITGINTGSNQIFFVPLNSAPGPTTAPATSDNVTFGPAIPQLSVSSAGGAVGNPASYGTGTTSITLSGAIGSVAGMRIQFLNHDNVTYTITAVGTNAAGQQTITLQPDGGGSTTGLETTISAGEGIRILPPVSGIVGLAGTISVNPLVINNSWRMRDGTRVQQPSTLTGNNTLPTSIVSMFNAVQTFTNNTGLPTSASLQNFGAAAIAFQANAAATTKASLDSASTIYNALNKQFQDQSGVNVDQQLAHMIQLQSSYEASARTITAVKQMLEQLLQAVQ